jgi:hypothetical protein
MFTAQTSNRMAAHINRLWSMRGEGGIDIYKADSGFVLESSAIASNDGTAPDDAAIEDFIFVGTGPAIIGPFGDQYDAQPVRNWSNSNTVSEFVVPDTVGIFGGWSANGNGDFTWRLQLLLDYPFAIERVELYQVTLQGNGGNAVEGVPFWNTGQAWATDSPINPLQNQPGFNIFLNPDGSFNVYPLRVTYGGALHGTGAILNTGYSGNISAGPYAADALHSFYFYGDEEEHVSSAEFFRVMLFLRNTDNNKTQNVIRGTIAAVPTDPETQI